MKTITALAVAALAAAPALGQQPPASGPALPMTRAQIQARVHERFAIRDANHDGFMTNDELGAAADMIIGRLDADHDGRVSFAEAMASTLADFDAADANHDGTVTQAEADAVTTQQTPPPTPSATPPPHGN